MFGTKTRQRKKYQEFEKLRRIASSTVLFYFQSWGQGKQGRIDALNKAASAAGIESVFEDADEGPGWRGPDNDKATEFRKELDRCFPRGQFEAEESAVMSLISRYRGK